MKLALRRDAAADATAMQRFACAAIKARLVSDYCHGGVVIGDALYHATAAHGLNALPAGCWTPEHWDLFDFGDSHDADARLLFMLNEGAAYDWIGLLAFEGLPFNDPAKLYCFEWCWFAMTGNRPTFRVTPEMLVRVVLEAVLPKRGAP